MVCCFSFSIDQQFNNSRGGYNNYHLKIIVRDYNICQNYYKKELFKIKSYYFAQTFSNFKELVSENLKSENIFGQMNYISALSRSFILNQATLISSKKLVNY